jgi:putative intracellular protease/amidase/YHS domain-containing protein
MKRRELLQRTCAFGFMAAIPILIPGAESQSKLAESSDDIPPGKPAPVTNPLKPPAQGSIPVAFVVSEGAVIIDFCGPWEVFQDADIPGRKNAPFRLYTVAGTTDPIRASGGMKIIPDYTLETAPAPKVIVIPAQNGATPAMLEWIRKSAKNADMTMSVCVGAFVLAKTGLLSGKAATTIHHAYTDLAMQFPDIQVKRGARFVDEGNIASSGGLSSGIDLALHVVERYYGREIAKRTAYFMEYQGQGWLDANSNQVYAKAPISTDEHPLCPVCGMDGDPSLKSAYKGKAYYFCMAHHKEVFDTTPEKFVASLENR